MAIINMTMVNVDDGTHSPYRLASFNGHYLRSVLLLLLLMC